MAERELNSVLEYLAEIGYGDLYLTSPSAGPAVSGAEPGSGGAPLSGGAAPGVASSGGASPSAAATVAARSDSPPGDRAGELAALAREASACTRCRLSETRHSVVFGSGNPNADLMFIGEGPGAQEDRQGLPFVGPAGALLTRIIEAIDLTREQVYIANIVKCRPPGNRDPRPDEVAACLGYLKGQIALIAPKVIVALGKVAAQTLLGTDFTLGRMRGQWYEVFGVQTRVTYHPAALLRSSRFKRPTWEDMQVVRDRLRS